MDQFCKKFGSKQQTSTMYNALANGLAKAFNKILYKLLKKVIPNSNKDWDKQIGEALWVYRTSFWTPTHSMPYALVYGIKVILSLEHQIPSLWIAIQGLTDEENVRLQLVELKTLDEKRLEAQ